MLGFVQSAVAAPGRTAHFPGSVKPGQPVQVNVLGSYPQRASVIHLLPACSCSCAVAWQLEGHGEVVRDLVATAGGGSRYHEDLSPVSVP